MTTPTSLRRRMFSQLGDIKGNLFDDPEEEKSWTRNFLEALASDFAEGALTPIRLFGEGDIDKDPKKLALGAGLHIAGQAAGPLIGKGIKRLKAANLGPLSRDIFGDIPEGALKRAEGMNVKLGDLSELASQAGAVGAAKKGKAIKLIEASGGKNVKVSGDKVTWTNKQGKKMSADLNDRFGERQLGLNPRAKGDAPRQVSRNPRVTQETDALLLDPTKPAKVKRPFGAPVKGEIKIGKAEAKSGKVELPKVDPKEKKFLTKQYKLPTSTSRSKPKYGFKDRQFDVEFGSDYDKAAYIVAGKGKSKAHDVIVDSLKKAGFDVEKVIQRGTTLRQNLKAQAATAPQGATSIKAMRFTSKKPASATPPPPPDIPSDLPPSTPPSTPTPPKHPDESLFSKTMRNVLGFPKSVKTMIDLPTLRQGLDISLRDPKLGFESIKKGVKSYSNKGAADVFAELEADPLREGFKKAGLGLDDVKQHFPSDFAADYIPLVKRSANAYRAAMETLRQGFMNKEIQRLQGQGKVTLDDFAALLSDETPKTQVPSVFKDAAKLTNDLSGFGKLGRLEPQADLLASAFFSPRKAVADFSKNINLVRPGSAYGESGSEFLKTRGIKGAAIGGALGAKELLDDDDVEWDVRSPNFGIKFDDTVLDVTGGEKRTWDILSQLAHGGEDVSRAGNVRPTDIGSIGRGYLSPGIPSMLGDILSAPSNPFSTRKDPGLRTDIIGRDIRTPLEITDDFEIPYGEWISNQFTPMLPEDIYDLWTTQPPEIALPFSGLALGGASSITYNDFQPYQSKQTKPTRGRGYKVYR